MKILTITSLYPNGLQPRHGIFVKTRFDYLDRIMDFARKVIAPVAWTPVLSWIPGSRFHLSAKVPQKENQNGIDVFHPRYLTLPGSNLIDPAKAMATAAIKVIEKTFDHGEEFDLIDGQYLYPDGIAAALVARKFSKPLVLTARGSDVNYWMNQDKARQKTLEAIGCASAVICVSQALKQSLMKHGVPEGKLFVLPNGVDESVFHRRHKAVSHKDYLLSVGNLVPLKGHDIALRGLATLPDKKLIIIGQGPEEKNLKQLARELAIYDRVIFLGHVPQRDLARYYAYADATLLMSSMEGMPNVVLESLACGTPVIATNVGGIPEVVNETNGILLSERTPDALEAALTDFFNRSWDRDAISDAMVSLDWSSVAQWQYELYQSVITGQQPQP
ncbi:glycosyltransferase [Emcibacter sp.]|uniref:glycosyltransferase n=1 Tax=Emcibacter sp. TaxID=1979954 RepID=UPI002AA7FEAC|nr:glycosyltransferase [Emcibacter sp.]